MLSLPEWSLSSARKAAATEPYRVSISSLKRSCATLVANDGIFGSDGRLLGDRDSDRDDSAAAVGAATDGRGAGGAATGARRRGGARGARNWPST